MKSLAISISLLIVLTFTSCSKVEHDSPNILFIMTDDQGAWTPSYTGHKGAVTPNIDRLKAEGMTFPNTFVETPVCSPSRATLMTGRYASETNVTDYVHDDHTGLNPAFTCWPEMLQKAGYKTGLIGKWHIGHVKPEHHPTNHGFDYFMGLKGGGIYGLDPKLEKDGKEQVFKGFMVDILTDDAMAFMETHKDKPFALSLHYRAPHAAYLPVSDEVWKHHKVGGHYVPDYKGLPEEKVKTHMKEYCAAVTGIDVNIGRLLTKLDDLKIADNTVVIFTSDHGYNVGHHGIWAKGNGVWMMKKPKKWLNISPTWRPNLWNTSLRVPFIVRWPNTIKPGSVRQETIGFTDIFPTICSIAGVNMSSVEKLRGQDATPLLKGKTIEWDNSHYAEYDMRHGGSKSYMRSLTTGKWKLMVDFNNPGRGDFYNLANDPDELTNLFYQKSSDMDSVKKTMLKKILSHMKTINDPMLKNIQPWMDKMGWDALN